MRFSPAASCASFALMSVVMVAAAHGQQAIPLDAKTIAFVTDPQKLEDKSQFLRAAAQDLIPGCAAIEAARGTTTVVKKFTFDEAGQATAGMFLEQNPYTGCGKTVRINAAGIIESDGKVRRVRLLPGNTNASPELQRDAIRAVIQYASTEAEPDCKTYAVRDTERSGYIKDDAAAKLLPREIWTVDACGKTVPVQIVFTTMNDTVHFAASKVK